MKVISSGHKNKFGEINKGGVFIEGDMAMIKTCDSTAIQLIDGQLREFGGTEMVIPKPNAVVLLDGEV